MATTTVSQRILQLALSGAGSALRWVARRGDGAPVSVHVVRLNAERLLWRWPYPAGKSVVVTEALLADAETSVLAVRTWDAAGARTRVRVLSLRDLPVGATVADLAARLAKGAAAPRGADPGILSFAVGDHPPVTDPALLADVARVRPHAVTLATALGLAGPMVLTDAEELDDHPIGPLVRVGLPGAVELEVADDPDVGVPPVPDARPVEALLVERGALGPALGAVDERAEGGEAREGDLGGGDGASHGTDALEEEGGGHEAHAPVVEGPRVGERDLSALSSA